MLSWGVHLTGVHLTACTSWGVHLMGVYLMGVHLMGVHLMGVHLIDVYMLPNPKALEEPLRRLDAKVPEKFCLAPGYANLGPRIGPQNPSPGAARRQLLKLVV